MSHLDDDVLAAVAIGDASAADESHLRECPTCAAELQDLQDLMQAMSASGPVQALETPPARVWEAISAQVANDQTIAPDANGQTTSPGATRQLGGTDELAGRRAKRSSTWTMLSAAAAGVVIGGVAVAGLLSSGPAEQGQIVASALLTDLATEQPAGDAVIQTRSDGTQVLVIDADAPEVDDAYLEVWLIDESIEGMVSLGHLTQGSGEFEIPAGFDVAGFPIVDISVEPFDGVPTHSGESVTRGVLDV